MFKCCPHSIKNSLDTEPILKYSFLSIKWIFIIVYSTTVWIVLFIFYSLAGSGNGSSSSDTIDNRSCWGNENGTVQIISGEIYIKNLTGIRDKCTIGKYSACLQEWGTNDGISGEGGRGFIRMNKFLKENNINTKNLELLSHDTERIGYRGSDIIEHGKERDTLWIKYANSLL